MIEEGKRCNLRAVPRVCSFTRNSLPIGWLSLRVRCCSSYGRTCSSQQQERKQKRYPAEREWKRITALGPRRILVSMFLISLRVQFRCIVLFARTFIVIQWHIDLCMCFFLFPLFRYSCVSADHANHPPKCSSPPNLHSCVWDAHLACQRMIIALTQI